MPFDPVSRSRFVPYEPYAWPDGPVTRLEPRTEPLQLDMVSLIEERQTRRAFGKRLDNAALGDYLWLACRNRSSRPSLFGYDQESRVYPSAGATHPIHVLLARETGPLQRYDPVAHALVALPGSDANAAASREAANSLVDLAHGTVIGIVAEPGKTAAKYKGHDSLVWRDAGVVLGYLSVIAEALQLPFCPLGITGQPYLTANLPNSDALQAVGFAVASGAEQL